MKKQKGFRFVQIHDLNSEEDRIIYTPENDWHCFIMAETEVGVGHDIEAGVPTPSCKEFWKADGSNIGECPFYGGIKEYANPPWKPENERVRELYTKCHAPLLIEK